MLSELFPWQRAAVEKLQGLKVGALYMDTGVGKTRTALELIELRVQKGKTDAVLWLCPCSVRENLRTDIICHMGGIPDTFIIKGIESISSSSVLYLQLLKLVSNHKVFLVVDESNMVKNPKALRSARIIELSKHCQYKLLLNGTPLSRNEADLFAQWNILDPRILGYNSYYSFAANHIEYFTIKDPRSRREIVCKDRIKHVLHVDYLTAKIAPYTYQIKKDECEGLELPDKSYITKHFNMTSEQQEVYQQVKSDYLLDVDELRSDTIYRLFTALQHVTSGRVPSPSWIKPMETEDIFSNIYVNPRIRCLEEIVEELRGEQCIIFAKYQTEVNEICQFFNDKSLGYSEFTGNVKPKQREENLSAFRNGTQFLVANKACGAYSLNLQFCHNVIFYSNDFDFATRYQAEDRVYRIGQTHEVWIYDICANNTIDEMIAANLDKKDSLLESMRVWIHKYKDMTTKEIRNNCV